MPSRHRRIGLVVDDDIDSALRIFRDASRSSTPDASLARAAVFEGALVEALMAAAGGSDRQDRAAVLLEELHDLLPMLRLPDPVRAHLAEALGRAAESQTREVRRRRQIELISSPNPHGRATSDYADTFDALDTLPR